MSDQVLRMMAERQTENHQENKETLRDIREDGKETRDLVAQMAAAHGLISHRVGVIEVWREKTTDPWIMHTRAVLDEVKGGKKMAKVMVPAMTAIGGGTIAAFGKSFLVFLGLVHP